MRKVKKIVNKDMVRDCYQQQGEEGGGGGRIWRLMSSGYRVTL